MGIDERISMVYGTLYSVMNQFLNLNKRNMKKNFLFLPLLALLSCTQQEIPDVPTLSEADGRSNNLVSLDEAIETARLYVSGLKGGTPRSADLILAKVDLLG